MASSSKKAVFYIALSLAQFRTARSFGVEKAVDVRLRLKVSDDLETRDGEAFVSFFEDVFSISSEEIRAKTFNNVTISSVVIAFPQKWERILKDYSPEKLIYAGYDIYDSLITIVPEKFQSESELDFSEMPISCGVTGSSIKLPGQNLPLNKGDEEYVGELTRSLARHLWGVYPERDKNSKWEERDLRNTNQTNFCAGKSVLEVVMSQLTSDTSASRRRIGSKLEEGAKVDVMFMISENKPTVNIVIESSIADSLRPFLKSLLFCVQDVRLNFIDSKSGARTSTFDLKDFTSDFFASLPKKTEGRAKLAPLTDILDQIGGVCGDLVLIEVGGYINVEEGIMARIVKMGCRVSWISVPAAKQQEFYGGELFSSKMKNIVKATGGKSFQFGVHGNLTGNDLPQLIPKFPHVTSLIGNVIKGTDSIQVMDFIEYSEAAKSNPDILSFIVEEGDIIQLQMRLISEIEHDKILEKHCLEPFATNVTDDEFLKLHSDGEFLIFTYQSRSRRDFNSYETSISLAICFYRLKNEYDTLRRMRGDVGSLHVQAAIFAINNDPHSMRKPKARIQHRVWENTSPIFAARPENYPDSISIGFVITSLNNPKYKSCGKMTNAGQNIDMFVDNWFTGLTTGLSCSSFNSDGDCSGYFMVEIYFNRVMLTKSCTLFNEDSSFRPFMKVEIGNLVLTGGDCYGGGKVTTARGEVCFKNYKNLDLQEQNCVLPTLDEAKHFSKKAKKLEYSFVENYDKPFYIKDDQREINNLLVCREHSTKEYQFPVINCSLIDENKDDKLIWCVEGIEDTFPPTFPLNFSIVEENLTKKKRNIENKKSQIMSWRPSIDNFEDSDVISYDIHHVDPLSSMNETELLYKGLKNVMKDGRRWVIGSPELPIQEFPCPPYFSGTLEVAFDELVANNASRLEDQFLQIINEFHLDKRVFLKLQSDKFVFHKEVINKDLRHFGADVKIMVFFGNGTALKRTDAKIEVVVSFGGDLPLENIKESICEIESGNNMWLAARAIDTDSNRSPFSAASMYRYKRAPVKSNNLTKLSEDVEGMKIVMAEIKKTEAPRNFFEGISKNTWIAIGSVFLSTAIVLFTIIKCIKHACTRRKERRRLKEERDRGHITGPSSNVSSKPRTPPVVVRKKKRKKKKMIRKMLEKGERISSDD